jgi:PilZ domain-containing protein
VEPEFGSGTPLVVFQRETPKVQWTGVVVAARSGGCAARISSPPQWDAAAQLMLIAGTPGKRWVASGRFAAAQGEVVGFSLVSSWQPFDLRKSPRVSADLQAEVRSVLGQSKQPGRLIDISAGGMAVSVATKPGGSALEVAIWANGYAAQLPCEVISSNQADGGVVLHLKFQPLSPPQQAFVRQVVATLMAGQHSGPLAS